MNRGRAAIVAAAAWVAGATFGAVPAAAQLPVDPARVAAARDVERRPADAGARMRLAGALLNAGDSASAEHVLRDALGVSGIDRRTIALALAELLGARGRFEDAIAVIDRALPADGGARQLRARLSLAAASSAARAGRVEVAERHWRAAVAADASLAEAWAGLVMHAELSGARDSALALLSRGLRHAPADARLLAIRASLSPSDSATAAALRAVRASRAVEPSESNGLALAALLRQAGQGDAVLALLDTLLAADKPGPDVFRLAAGIRRNRGELDSALALLARAQRLHSSVAELYADEAVIRHDRREWRLAARAWVWAATRVNDPTPYQFALAETFAASGDTAEARAQLRPLASAERPAHVAHRAALRLRGLGDTAAATAAWHALLVRDSNDVAANIGLAEAADAAHEPALARSYWLRAEPDPRGGPWPALALARAASAARDENDARRWIRRALWRGMESLAGAEQRAVGSLERANDRGLADARPDLAERDRLIAALEPLVDSLASDPAWGVHELDELERAWKGSPVLRRARARAAVARGDLADAARRYDELLLQRPGDAALRFEAGEVYARVGRVREARAAFVLALDLDPEADAPFRALIAADRSDTALVQLEAQIRRLRLRLPQSIVLADRLVEVLHRRGLADEAAAAARDLERLRAERGGRPQPGGEP